MVVVVVGAVMLYWCFHPSEKKCERGRNMFETNMDNYFPPLTNTFRNYLGSILFFVPLLNNSFDIEIELRKSLERKRGKYNVLRF